MSHRLNPLVILLAASVSASALVDDFSSPEPPSGIAYEAGSHTHDPARKDGELNLKVNKRGWDGWNITFPAPVDLSANPVVSMRVRAVDRDVEIRLFAVQDYATGNYGAAPGSSVEVIRSADFRTVSFNLSGAEKVDLTKVHGILVNFNPGSDFEGEVVIDDLKIGAGAVKMPSITMPDAITLPLGAAPVTVRAHDVRSQGFGDKVELTAASSNPAIVPKPEVARALDVNAADLTIKPLALGQAEITVTATAAGAEPKPVVLRVSVVPNQAPTMDEIPTLDAAAKQAVTVRVTGVSDGDPDARQKVSVTAVSSNPALVTVKANYASTGKDPAFAGESRLALLEVTPAAGAQGEAEITVTARDDGGTAGGGTDVFARTFKVKVFPALNPAPKLDDFRLETFDGSDDAVRRIYIGGLDNGAGIPDGLGIKATSSNPALVPDPVVEYRPGDTHGFLVLSAPGAGTGEAAIAVTVTDADAKADNNGAQSATKTLAVLVRPDPVVDFVEEYNVPGDAEAIARFPETEKAHFLTLPDSDKGSLRIDVKKKFVWAGLWYQLPKEIDITDSMRISVRMRTDSATPVKCRMYLMDCHKNYSAPAPGPEVEIQSGGFQDYVFDFRGNLAGALGRPVDPSRIYRLLINFDPGKELETVVYFDDLRIGRSARSPQTQPLVTMDPVPDVFLLQGAGRQEIVVTGLGDGFDGSKTVTLTAKAANPSVVKDLKVEPMEFGRTKITFSAGGVGDSVVDLAAEALGSTPAKAAFKVVVSAGASPVDVQVNKATTFQTIEGLGAYIASPGASSITLTNPVRGAELARDLGMSLARLGIIEADWEPANDNANAMASDFPMATDPAWLESAERLAKFKRLSGVDRYIMSVWAPGAFMMHLKGRSCFSAMALQGSTPDTYPFTLNPAYLDEFTEHLSAWHHWLSERAGIDLYATSLGNEIQFTQTYPSAVYGIGYYHRVWRALGKRLEKEGLPPWQFGAEILPAQHEVLAYMRPLIEDPDSAKYIRALAYHGYVGLGVDPGSGDARQLASFHDEMSKIGKGVWMTETSGNSDDWKGAYELGEAMFACLTTGRNAAWVFWTFANNTDEGGYLLANRWTPGGRFYAVKQMMKHIRPGDVMLDATSGDSSVTPAVFRSAEGGRMVLVLKNGAAEMKPVKVPDLGGPADVYQSAEYRHHVYLGQCKSGATILLPPHSFTTLVSAPAPGGTAEEPVLYPRHASTGTPLRVQVTTPTDGAVIRYTTDGSVPVESSPAASNPLMLTKDTLLKVRAFRPGMEPSPVGGAYYQFAGE